MKKTIAMIFALTSILTLVSCNSKKEEKTEGEILAQSFHSTSYMNMSDLISNQYQGSNGSYVGDIASGIQSGILSLMSKKPDSFVAWATSSIFKLIFDVKGEDQSQKILDTLSTMEDKMDEINKKLDQVLVVLDSLMEKQEISALKDDINTLRTGNAYLQTYIDYTKNLDIGKGVSDTLDEKTTLLEYTALNKRFQDAPTQLNNYMHLLFDPGAKSGKNIFYNISRIIKLNHFIFDSQEVQLKAFNDSVYLTPFIYASAIVYSQLNFIMKTSSPSSVEYIDASSMFETTRKNVERVKKAYEENKIERKKEGYISFLYPNSDDFISFYPTIRNINSDTYINHHVDKSRLKDKKYWKDWAYACQDVKDEEDKTTKLYAANMETTNMILDCINTLVKNRKMDDVLFSDLLSDSGFYIPAYTGYGDNALRFFALDDLEVHSMYSDTFYQVTQTLSGTKTGDAISNRKVTNWGIGNIDKEKVSMYGWQSPIAILLTDKMEYGYPSTLKVDEKGNIL